MNEGTVRNKANTDTRPSAGSSKLGGILSGRINGNAWPLRNPNKALKI